MRIILLATLALVAACSQDLAKTQALAVAEAKQAAGAADGAEPADVAITGPAEIEVGIGDDHHRVSATVEGAAAK